MTNDELFEEVKAKVASYDFPLPTSKLFIDLDHSDQLKYNELLSGLDIGSPLLFYLQKDKGWVTIGTKRIAIHDGLKTDTVELDKVVSIKPDADEKAKRRNEFEDYKFELSNWLLVDPNGNEYKIRIEKGKTYYSFYHVLQKILRLKGIW